MTRRTRRALLRGTGLLAIGGLAGCQSAGEPESTPTETATPTATQARPSDVGATCSSEGTDFRFSPGIQQVEVGKTVKWSGASQCKQQSVAYHPDNDAPLRIPEDAQPWESPVLKTGESFEHTLETEGVYNYFGLYEQFGQVGIVIVGDPAPDPKAEPGLAEPQEDIPEEARTALGDLIADAEEQLS